MIYLTKVYQLKSAHMLEHELKINSGKTHGHTYQIEITVQGEPDPISGLIISRDHMDCVVKEHILDVYDHTFLNDKLDHTSGEWIASEWYKRLKGTTLGAQLVCIQIQETAKNRFLSAAVEPLIGQPQKK